MIIQSDSISLNSHRSYEETTIRNYSLSVWDNRTGETVRNNVSEVNRYTENDDFSEEGQSESTSSEKENTGSMRDLMEQFRSTQSIQGSIIKDRIKTIDEIKQQSIDYLLYLLFGKKVKAPDLSIYASEDNVPFTSDTIAGAGNIGQGGHYDSYFSYSEKEVTSFHTKGTVVTADGHRHSFNIDLNMSRSFQIAAQESIDFGAPNLCDPLVINLSSNTAQVSDQKFFFDIDSDGKMDEISYLNSGSGYLALDKNNDGIINDGSELFGTASGDGFLDLSAYDDDKNGWIDEADAIFDKLLIWTKDSSGNDKLCAIGKAGVGAIYLGSSETEFSLKSGSNATNAVIRKTGIFLYENGGCGTLQQLDLAT